MNTQITRTEATSEEVGKLVGSIEDACVGAPVGVAIIALLSLVILIQKPDISAEGIQTVLKDISNYICLALDGSPTEEIEDIKDVPTRLMN